MPDLFLGGPVDPTTGDRIDNERLLYDASDLTTHGVIVGMTGSGKTGLGVIFLEEALRAGIPTLVLDPKGDMTNLALRFPSLAPEDFEPWIDPAVTADAGTTVVELATETARRWRDGLASWGLSEDDIAELDRSSEVTIYTPGSSAGVPLDIVGRLDVPDLDWETDGETIRDEIQGFASGLLGLIGIDADPVTSREHILISNLVERAWRDGRSLDMATLLGWIQRPPMRKLGVFDVDAFFPPDDRMELAMRLNGLLASPGFATWMEGEPLDIQRLLWDGEGRPKAAVVYLAHLTEEERQFVVTSVLTKVVTWMRSQSGTGELRALVYMDEVFGFVPPTAMPPAKKPILTLLKQARAFGVGLLLSTQNPVDLDYKAMSNAGTWAIGRLQTERDKARILEALRSAGGDVDVEELDAQITGLGKRRFLLHDVHEPAPVPFTTRWAMSYLRGPLTKDQIETLTARRRPSNDAGRRTPRRTQPATSTLPDDVVPAMPPIADGIPVAFVDAAAPWAQELGADPTSHVWEAGLAARVTVRYDERRADIDHVEEWEAIYFPAPEPFDASSGIEVDYDERDLQKEAPPEAGYRLPAAPVDDPSYFRDAKKAIAAFLRRESTLEILHNAALKLWSRPGEDLTGFQARCVAVAEDRIDEELAKLRDRYATKVKTLQRRLRRAQQRAATAEEAAEASRQEELMGQAGAVVDLLLGRRPRRSVAARSRSRRSAIARAEAAQEKVLDVQEDLADLEADLADDVEEITDRWMARAAEIESVDIGLESDDIDVRELRVVWVPVPVD